MSVYSGGYFTLELDQKKPVGFVSSVDGGHFKSDAVKSPIGGRPGQSGGDFLVQQFAGKPKYEDITLVTSMAMSPPFWAWVKATLDNKPERRDGAVVSYDYALEERSRRTFKRALISEVQFPAADAKGKGGQNITVKISPEKLEWTAGDKSKMKTETGPDGPKKQKLWTQSSFRFKIDKIGDDASLRAAKVDAFTVKQGILANPVGSELESRKEVGKLELPNIVCSFPEAYVKPWMEWYKATVVEGKRETSNGYLSYQATNAGNNELLKVEFFGMSLLSLEFEKSEALKDGLAMVKATLTLEGMSITPGSGTV
jgi:hypothetical protein